MDNNNLRYLHCHHLFWHCDRILPYFEFDNMEFVKDSIKGITKTKMENIEAKIKEVTEAKRNILDVEKRKRPDTSV